MLTCYPLRWQSSPRSWRCFSFCHRYALAQLVFSTLVEVFRAVRMEHKARQGLLHARGGVSIFIRHFCFHTMSSPRSWRCFLTNVLLVHSKSVFSTLVEVFLWNLSLLGWKRSLLHARGGVSLQSNPTLALRPSSPRSWRCFLGRYRRGLWRLVFSTLVEVFLRNLRRLRPVCSLLHARGGVSDLSEADFDVSVSSPRSWRCFFRFSDFLSA